MITLHHGDCLDILPTLEAGSVDMVLADPPYGTTACSWDSVIDFPSMWQELKRVIKPNGAIVLFGSQPFTSALVMSNPKWFRHCWIWEKTIAANFMNAKHHPMKLHEEILLFSPNKFLYNPQMGTGQAYNDRPRSRKADVYSQSKSVKTKSAITNRGTRNPSSIIRIPNPNQGNLHPTQKPVALLAYLIRTYTNKGDTVLDFCMGSGSTGVACIEEGRSFIGIEKDAGYFEIAKTRIHEAETAPRTMRMELTA